MKSIISIISPESKICHVNIDIKLKKNLKKLLSRMGYLNYYLKFLFNLALHFLFCMNISTLNSRNAFPTYTNFKMQEDVQKNNNNNFICNFPNGEYQNSQNLNDSFNSDDEIFNFIFNFDLPHDFINQQTKELNICDTSQINKDNKILDKKSNCSSNALNSSEKRVKECSQSSRCSTRASKRKVGLTQKADLFKKMYYQIFTSKKKFPKMLVKQIHEIILVPCFLDKMSREEYRRIDLYFQDYAKYSDRISLFILFLL